MEEKRERENVKEKETPLAGPPLCLDQNNLSLTSLDPSIDAYAQRSCTTYGVCLVKYTHAQMVMCHSWLEWAHCCPGRDPAGYLALLQLYITSSQSADIISHHGHSEILKDKDTKIEGMPLNTAGCWVVCFFNHRADFLIGQPKKVFLNTYMCKSFQIVTSGELTDTAAKFSFCFPFQKIITYHIRKSFTTYYNKLPWLLWLH